MYCVQQGLCTTQPSSSSAVPAQAKKCESLEPKNRLFLFASRFTRFRRQGKHLNLGNQKKLPLPLRDWQGCQSTFATTAMVRVTLPGNAPLKGENTIATTAEAKVTLPETVISDLYLSFICLRTCCTNNVNSCRRGLALLRAIQDIS